MGVHTGGDVSAILRGWRRCLLPDWVAIFFAVEKEAGGLFWSHKISD